MPQRLELRQLGVLEGLRHCPLLQVEQADAVVRRQRAPRREADVEALRQAVHRLPEVQREADAEAELLVAPWRNVEQQYAAMARILRSLPESPKST